MFRIANHTIVALLFLLLCGTAVAADVNLNGVIGTKALVVVDSGKSRLLAIGQTSPEGVKLISITGESAMIETGGKAVTLEQIELSRVRAENAASGWKMIFQKNDGVLHQGCTMKCAWIDDQRKAHSLPAMCETLAISISGYRAWKRGGNPNHKRLTDAQLMALIRAIYKELMDSYGSLDYIEIFYNRSRRNSTLGYQSPVQFLQDWITTQHERKMAA